MSTQVEPGRPSPVRPTGSVTFLFSDIEGSTSRWDADPAAMTPALARHDALMRTKLESYGAYIFKTMGDAFCAAFASPAGALAAAIDAQRALQAEDFSAVLGLRVRMALHVGTAEERDGDYFGPTVNRAARLLAIGHGGQVLVSGAVAELLYGESPPKDELLDLGRHRLKDLASPECVYQILASGLQESFPPLTSLDRLNNNLPAQLTTFVGRDTVVTEIKTLLDRNRLVTLTGSGGAGKTRCAIQVAADLVDAWSDGVWLAELAPVPNPALVPGVIAKSLHVQEQPNRPPLETLLAYLKRKRLLLVLDNCEHVIDEARRVAAAILRDCPDVRILTTSREPLNVSGEAAYRVPSLAVPPDRDSLASEGAQAYGASQLFVDRALLADNRFALTPENAPYVADLCRRLDGIPLALELAAARVKILSPQQLLEKLDERFRVLTGGDRSALPRHQTMRALIDWSYDLLADDERSLFRTLAIFAGGFTLQTAAAVCCGGDGLEVLDPLSALVDKSLVLAEPLESGTRYRLLESTRQYAAEKLSQAGEYETVALAHARAFGDLARPLEEAWESTPDETWLSSIEPEMENYRAAMSWAFGANGDIRIGQQLASDLRKVWMTVGVAEGRRWIELAQERAGADTPIEVAAALDLAEASFAGRFHQFKKSLALGERALSRYREIGNPSRQAMAKEIVADAYVMLGNTREGAALLNEALAERRALGARKSAAGVLIILAQAREFEGDIAGAREQYREALVAAQTAGAQRISAVVAMNLAEAEFRADEAEAAVRAAHEALAVLRTLADTQMVAIVMCNCAAYLVALSRYDEARAMAREALRAASDTQYASPRMLALQHLAAVAALRLDAGVDVVEDRRRAAKLMGFVDARFADLDESRDYTEKRERDAVIPVLQHALGPDVFEKLTGEGSTWDEEQALSEAMRV